MIFVISALLVLLLYVLYRLEGVKKDLKGLIAIVDRGLQRDLVQVTRQLQSLNLLEYKLSLDMPLPPTRAYAASPDFLVEIYDAIKKYKPNCVVEFGSGVSTLVISRALQQQGAGRLLSFDHDADWAQKTRDMLIEYGVDEYSEVVVAPLTEVSGSGGKVCWYEDDKIPAQGIDFFVIDGPPMNIDPLVRKPALDVLYQRLSERAVGFLDDAGRDGEKAIARAWAEEYPDLSQTYLYLEKGALKMEKGQ